MVVNHEWFQIDLPQNLRSQFEQGYESRYGLIDEQKIVDKVNQALKSDYSLEQIKHFLATERTTNQAAVTYRLLYDYEYEQIIHYFKV